MPDGNSFSDDRGFAHFAFVTILLIMAMGGFGVWSIFRNWQFQVEHQLRLNQCVGEVAQNFRNHLNKIETLNKRIRQLRLATAAAKLYPSLLPPLYEALAGVVILQDSILVQWKIRQLKWMADRGCQNRKDLPWPLPELLYQRDLPDDLGLKPLVWPGEMPNQFRIQVSWRNRHAAARIQKQVDSEEVSPEFWKAYWAVPISTSKFSRADGD